MILKKYMYLKVARDCIGIFALAMEEKEIIRRVTWILRNPVLCKVSLQMYLNI